ncbi:shematrin-like protein 2 isoform X3 [Drosophila navojoa]|uniref:shematrin-like protein 2 isoform X3 n=1 Tax=Drosophila navojoa TaxID=7232 RepID=UPI0011BEAE80|nr:shematrin-like protein 2 isoform X3 [Drosophila navojoa]
MWKLLLICIVMSALYTEGDAASSSKYTRKVSRRRRGYAGGYAGGYASSGGGVGGYTGTYNDYDDYGYAPNFGITDPYLFHQQLTNQILAQNYATQQRIQQQIAAQQAYHDNLVRQNSYRGGSSSHRYAPSYALAAGSIGANGHRQTAYISPANAASPNIVNRFGSSSGGGGYKGVSVSSYSSSNGDGTSRRGAQTTVNDNGKVTSYSVHS